MGHRTRNRSEGSSFALVAGYTPPRKLVGWTSDIQPEHRCQNLWPPRQRNRCSADVVFLKASKFVRRALRLSYRLRSRSRPLEVAAHLARQSGFGSRTGTGRLASFENVEYL